MKLEIWVTKHTHLRTIKTFDLNFFADANRRDEITDFEPYECHHETEDRHSACIDHLHDEL